jgi:hypothetical protein
MLSVVIPMSAAVALSSADDKYTTFCTEYMDVCQNGTEPDAGTAYASMKECITAMAMLPDGPVYTAAVPEQNGNSFNCKKWHLDLAPTNDVHCGHAQMQATAFCIGDVEFTKYERFCRDYLEHCMTVDDEGKGVDGAGTAFASMESCKMYMEQIDEGPAYTNVTDPEAETFNCKRWHLDLAPSNDVHCKHAQEVATAFCVDQTPNPVPTKKDPKKATTEAATTVADETTTTEEASTTAAPSSALDSTLGVAAAAFSGFVAMLF